VTAAPTGGAGEVRPDVVARLRAAGCVFAEDEAALLAAEARSDRELDTFVARRAAGAPVQHVVGWASFGGLRIAVTPGVFVPRVRSGLLAAQAARRAVLARTRTTRPVVVDLCCGSGALGLVVATRVPGVQVHAADIDPAAVACARDNLTGVTGAQVHLGDLDAALPSRLRGRVDVMVANVPYVPTAAVPSLPAEARRHEAAIALDGGADGLDVVRRVAAAAPAWLAPGGTVLVEAATTQAPAAAAVFAEAGLTAEVVASDELEVAAVLGVVRAAG
jgi:release factor glutamine methyltransferase